MTCEECIYWIVQQPVSVRTAERCDEHIRACDSCRAILDRQNARINPLTGFPRPRQ